MRLSCLLQGWAYTCASASTIGRTTVRRATHTDASIAKATIATSVATYSAGSTTTCSGYPLLRPGGGGISTGNTSSATDPASATSAPTTEPAPPSTMPS